MNIEVIGISRDHAASQAKFKETVNAKNTFLSDQDAKIISAYGALSAQRVANRYYFLIDESGKLIWKSVTGLGKVQRRFLDSVSGQAAYFGIVEEGTGSAIVTARIRVPDGFSRRGGGQG